MARYAWRGTSFADIDLRLCTSCGTCISACPVKALAWRGDETIAFDRATCTDCGICYAICPPENPTGRGLPSRVSLASSSSSSPEDSDPLIGPYTGLWRGCAADAAIREAGSAGGAVTALLVAALEQGTIDGALVVTDNPADPTRPAIIVARSAEEIRAAAQSKYCLAPVNALLDQIKDTEGKLAVVALPCQAHGLRLAQALNLAIARKVVLVIGIFCGFNVSYAGTAYLLHKLGMAPGDLATLEHRGGPWPGGFRAVAQDGREGFIPKHQYTYVHLMYAPEGCWYCPDLTAEFADLSVGDYWVGEARGYSSVIARTETGVAWLDRAQASGRLVVEEMNYDEMLLSHQHLLSYKKKGVQVRRSLSGRRPVEGYNLPTLTAKERAGSALFYGMIRFSSSRLGRWLIGRLPLGLTGLLSARGRELFRSKGR